MSRPLRIFEGRFGRLILAEAPEFFAAGENTAPVILFKHQGADCTLRIGSAAVPLTRDDVIFVEPLEAHGGNGTPGATRVIEFHPSPDWLNEAFPESFQPIGGRVFAHPREAITPRMRQLADTLAVEALNDQFLSPERLEFMLQELMLAVVENYLARRRAGAALWRGSRFADTRIRKALGLLRARPNKDVNIDDLASQVGLSRSRFYDLFHLSTGRSPRAYLDMLCVESAIAKLSGGRARIADVSAELGFSAQSNFTRFFLTQVGIPPSEYRRAASRPEGAVGLKPTAPQG
ncbi:MAG: helix-turn-helix domain-containing protein [Burkholderiales bacterium]